MLDTAKCRGKIVNSNEKFARARLGILKPVRDGLKKKNNLSKNTPSNNTANELVKRGALLLPSAIPCSLSPLTSHIHSSLFSDWRRTVSPKFFDTQVLSVPVEEFMLPRHACCVLLRLCCSECRLFKTLISQESVESKILHAAPAVI